MKYTRSEEAVSPVIGVILMVAITVILAAVIGAFVFNIAGSTSSSKTVAITSSLNGSNYAVFTIQGGPDLSSLQNLSIVTKNVTAGTSSTDYWTQGYTVGASQASTVKATGNRTMIVGVFSDGSSQILFDKQY